MRSWRGRLLRWSGFALGALLALLGALLLALWLLLGSLDQPWIKSQLLALCRDTLGLGVDYEGLEVSLRRGVRARSLRLLTPAPLAAGATDFVRIEGLELRTALWRWALGQRTIEALTLRRLEVALVQDDAGRTTLGELFPEPAEPEPSQPWRPSQLLAELPAVSVHALAVEALAARRVELGPGGARRSLELRGGRASGALHTGGHGLAGSRLLLQADPLAVELTDGARAQRAELDLSLELAAEAASALGVRARLGLRAQDFVPSAAFRGELLALDARLDFDAAASKTRVTLAALRALGDALSLQADAELLDRDGLSARLGGSLHAALDALPIALPGLTLEALTLDATARELSWDGARVAGHLDASGRLRGLGLEQAGSLARLEDVTLLALGTFEPQGGRLHATLGAAAAQLDGPGGAGELDDLSLIVSGTTREAGGVQALEASATLGVGRARLEDGAGGTLALEQARLHALARAPVPELAASRLPRLELGLQAQRVTHAASGQRTLLERPAASGVFEQLARDAGATGVRGDGHVTLHLPSLRVSDGARRALLEARELELALALPATLESLQGTLALGGLTAGETQLRGLALELEASSPLGWQSERAAHVLARGRLSRIEAGSAKGRLEELRLLASKAEHAHYRVELDARGTSLVVGGQPLPPIRAGVRAQAAPNDGSLALSATLAGSRGGAFELDARARFEPGPALLRYELDASARELEAFAEAAGVERGAARRLGGARLTASARGELAGVLQATERGWPEAAPRPLLRARGKHSATLRLDGLDYQGPERTLRIPRLDLALDAAVGEGGGGTASARLVVPALELDAGGSSLRLAGLEQALEASFERAPDQGIVDVNASLALGSAEQSLLPGVPLRDVQLSSHVQLDRLRSIFLRELSLDNAASGSSLRAAGTLELSTHADPESDAALTGREALFFEGRLTQQLAPFEKLGLASHASGALEVPFRLESGGLLGYRLLAALEAKQVSWVSKDGALAVEGLDGTVPVVEEFALLDGGPVISAGPRTSPLSDTRFFDVHPFLAGNDYVTARSVRFGAMQPLGPIAANVRVERSDFLIDQLQAGYQGGQIVGQVRVAYRNNDPIVRLRLNATGVRSGKKREVFDANTALTFVPRALTLDGKAQIVRASREHLEDILNVLDPFHESANANRVRQGLTVGYPKFVRFQLHDGTVDTKVELGGLAKLVRIDEIRAVPLGPILQKYVAPALAGYLTPAAPTSRAPAQDTGEAEPSARREPKE